MPPHTIKPTAELRKMLRFAVPSSVLNSDALAMIEGHYGHLTASRSKVPLIHHIYEGLVVLARTGMSAPYVMQAYAVHPLFQDGRLLETHWSELMKLPQHVITFAMEYRSVANAGIRKPVGRTLPIIRGWESAPSGAFNWLRLSDIAAVNSMLVADKVQNHKDFSRHFLCGDGLHPEATDLQAYFEAWFSLLHVTQDQRDWLLADL